MPLLLLFALILTAWLYKPGLSGSFFFDDQINLLDQESLQLKDITVQDLGRVLHSGIASPTGRPLSQLSFALNYYFSGFDPFAFKATNLAIHLINGLLVFLVVRKLSRDPFLPLATSALWLLSPIQLTAVLYVVQRMTSLATLFLLSGFLFHITARESNGSRHWAQLFLAWIVFWPLSFFSKEIGIIFPLLILAWELTLRRATTGYIDTFAKTLLFLCGTAVLLGGLYAASRQGQWIWAGYQFRDFTLAERLMTESRVIWFYLSLILFPRLDALSLFHDDIPISTGLFTPWTTSVACTGLLLAIYFSWLIRNRYPLLCFGIFWFFIAHGIESTVLPLEIAFEHRNYLPSFGILLGSASILTSLTERNGWRRTLGYGVLLSILAYFAVISGLRAKMYGNEITRTQIEAEFHPNSARSQYEAGRAIQIKTRTLTADSPQYFFIKKHYEFATRANPEFKYGLLGLIYLNCSAHVAVDARWTGELVRRIRHTAFAPGDRGILYDIKEMSIDGDLCLPREDVESIFNAALSNETSSPYVRSLLYSWLADYLTIAQHDFPAARTALEKALLLSPSNNSDLLKLAQLEYLLGDNSRAQKVLQTITPSKLLSSEKETYALLVNCLTNQPTHSCEGVWKKH